MSEALVLNCETFIALHEAQLKSSGVPEHFYKSLFDKISNEIFDAGEVKS